MKLSEWVVSELKGSSLLSGIVGERVYFLRTGKQVPAPWVMVGSVRTEYERTKDGLFPAAYEYVVECIAKRAEECDRVADAVVSVLQGSIVPALGCAENNLVSRAEDYDFEQEQYVYSLTFRAI